MGFKVEETGINGLKIITPDSFPDDRGEFTVVFEMDAFNKMGIENNFVQGNRSSSTKGVLRGLHFQEENTQGKYVGVSNGSVYDVAVDLREGSETYSKCYGLVLSAENGKRFFVPRGFAHGFLVLTEKVTFTYLCDDKYNKASENGICWNDPKLDIKWPLEEYGITAPILSEKDKTLPTVKKYSKGYVKAVGQFVATNNEGVKKQ